MKRIKNIILLSFVIFCLCSPVLFVAADIRDDIEFADNAELVWTVNIYEGPLDDYQDDFDVPKDLKLNEDLEGIKIKVEDIGKEKKIDGEDGSEIEVKYYETEDKLANDWELDDDIEEINVFVYDKDVYATGDFFEMIVQGGVIFVPRDVDWDELVDELDDELDDVADIDEFTISALENGISGEVEYDDMDVIDFVATYNDIGVLEKFELDYDGKDAIIRTLDPTIPGYPMLPFIGIMVLGILGSIYLIKRKK